MTSAFEGERDAAAANARSSTSPCGNSKQLRYGLPLALLTLVYTLSYIDRQIVNILAEGIKRDLGLSDTEIGLITGLSFALLYATLGVPVARIAEKANRVRIIAGALFIWSAFTILCGFARNATHLFLSRVGVGIGEAGSTPPSHSLIADYYPVERRASAIAVYSLGISLGSMLGAMIGGVAMHHLGWRGAFIIAGAPGLFVAIVVLLLIPEPRKGTPVPRAAVIPFLPAIKSLFLIRSFAPLVAAMTFYSVYGYGSAAFLPSFIFRNHGAALDRWSDTVTNMIGLDLGAAGTLGVVYGGLVGTASLAGTLAGGRLADHFGRSSLQAYATIPAAAMLVCWLAFVALLLSSTLEMVMALKMVAAFAGALIFGPVYASIQSVVPTYLRATASAVTLLIVNLIALGAGPPAIGAISDALRPALGEGTGLTYALLIASLPILLAAAALWHARRSIASDITLANREQPEIRL